LPNIHLATCQRAQLLRTGTYHPLTIDGKNCLIGLIANGTALDRLPSGGALLTVTSATPTEETSEASIDAVNRVSLTYTVDRMDPFHLTTEPETKFDPFTVSANEDLPTWVVDGIRLVMIGAGPVNKLPTIFVNNTRPGWLSETAIGTSRVPPVDLPYVIQY
jgi:hypothetical protein